jgi:hypothetical protein
VLQNHAGIVSFAQQNTLCVVSLRTGVITNPYAGALVGKVRAGIQP